MPDQVEVQQTTTKSVVGGQPEPASYQKKKVIFKAYQIIWYILGVVEVLLVFRVLLKLLAANSTSGFVTFVYNVSDPIALPFAGIFGITVSKSSVLEWSTFVAMAVYALIAFGIVKLIQLMKPTSPGEVERGVNQ